MLTIGIRGLPRSMTQAVLQELFAAHGRVFNVQVSRDMFSGECKGFAELKMEGHEARAAIAALNGSEQQGSHIRVALVDESKKRRGR